MKTIISVILTIAVILFLMGMGGAFNGWEQDLANLKELAVPLFVWAGIAGAPVWITVGICLIYFVIKFIISSGVAIAKAPKRAHTIAQLKTMTKKDLIDELSKEKGE